MRASITGIGYVGLVSGTCLAKTGNYVLCIDIDKKKVDIIKKGIVPMYKPHLEVLIPRIETYFNNKIKGKTFAVQGLAIKQETDDIREAPAFYIIGVLLSKGANVPVFDSEAMPKAKRKFVDQIQYALNKDEATVNADALIICTEWSVFTTPDFDKLKANLKKPVIFDG